MKTYRVWAKITGWAYMVVEAKSKEEAMKIGEEADGGEFTECDDREWEITEAVEE